MNYNDVHLLLLEKNLHAYKSLGLYVAIHWEIKDVFLRQPSLTLNNIE